MPLTAYPYTPRTGDCQGAFDSRKVSFAGAQVVDLSKPDNIVQALGKGPLAITIWADSNPDIQLYSTGIYAPPSSSSAKEDHAVTLVGYGTETLASGKTADYWIIKNRQGWPLAGWCLSVCLWLLSFSVWSASPLLFLACLLLSGIQLHQAACLCAVLLTCLPRPACACPTGPTLVQLGCELGGAGLRAPAQAALAGRPCGHLLGGHLLRLPPHCQRQ